MDNIGNKFYFLKTDLPQHLINRTNHIVNVKHNNKELNIKIDAKSEFYNNGIRCVQENLPKHSNFNAKILLKPYLIRYDSESNSAKVKYVLVQLFYVT